MNKLNLYISKQLLTAFAIVTVTLIMVVWLTRSLRFIDFIVNRGVSLSTFGYLTSLLLPTLLYVIMPITLFCAVVFVYNRLSQDSELIAAHASGVSPVGMARPGLIVAAGLTLVSFFFSLYLIPSSYQAFKDLQFEIRHDFSVTLLEEGAFTQISDNLTVFVQERLQDGRIQGILVHDTTKPDEPVTIIAEQGAVIETPQGPRVLVISGHRQARDEQTGNLSMLFFDEYTLDLSHALQEDVSRWRQPRERYLGELLWPSDDFNDVRYRQELIAEGHSRLITPLYNFSFSLAALYILLMSGFSRQGQSSKIILSVAVLIFWLVAYLSLENLAAKNNSFIPLMYLVWLLPTSLFLYMLLTARRAGAAVDFVRRSFTKASSSDLSVSS